MLPDILNGIEAEDDLVPESEREEEHSQKEESDEELQAEPKPNTRSALRPRALFPQSASEIAAGLRIIHLSFSHSCREQRRGGRKRATTTAGAEYRADFRRRLVHARGPRGAHFQQDLAQLERLPLRLGVLDVLFVFFLSLRNP